MDGTGRRVEVAKMATRARSPARGPRRPVGAGRASQVPAGGDRAPTGLLRPGRRRRAKGEGDASDEEGEIGYRHDRQPNAPPTIAELGFTRDQASEYQRLASVPASHAQNKCASIVKLAEHRIGGELRRMEKNKGAAAGRNALDDAEGVPDPPTLAELGFTHDQASEYQQLAERRIGGELRRME